MWIQDSHELIEYRRRMKMPRPNDYLVVNPRGRVSATNESRARQLLQRGFKLAPKKARAGDYLPDHDKGEQVLEEKPVIYDHKRGMPRNNAKLVGGRKSIEVLVI